MIVVFIHNFAHRLRQDGIMESAPVTTEKSRLITEVCHTDFQERSPESMSMTGGEYGFLRSQMKVLASNFAKIEPLPSAEKPKQPVFNPEAVL